MSGAIFVAAQPFTVSGASQSSTAPATNLAVDPPGMVWRSADLTAPYVVVATGGQPIDTIALVGSNLRATDQVHLRMGSDSAMSNPTVDRTIYAWSGITPKAGAVTLFALEMSVQAAYLRLDITSTGNPAGYVEASRLVIGQRLNCAGVNVGAEKSYQDGSTSEDALGSTIIDPFRTRDSWKVGVSNVDRTTYWSTWDPFFYAVGNRNSLLFVPDLDPSCLQNQACFGRIVSNAKSTWNSYGCCNLDINITQV